MGSVGAVTASRPVRIGLQIQPQHAEYAAIRRTVSAAEELGVDILFTWDNFYPLSSDPVGRHFASLIATLYSAPSV